MRRRTAAILARYSERAREAIWRAWLRHPDDERWELLTRYRGERTLVGAVLAAAIDPARAATARSAIGAFCVRRGIVPDGDAERALFYLMAGQWEQHRAADPDGSALTAAYQAAAEPVRAALRAAMADAGGLDLVRVVATRSEDGADAATEAEREYLAAELARRRDWPRLWRLALDLPLAETVAAARRLPADWRPADETGRQLLTRLAAAGKAEIAALATPTVTRLDLGRTKCNDCMFAPDGSEVAVNWWRPSGRRGPLSRDAETFITVHALPGGRHLDILHSVIPYPSRGYMLHLRDATVFARGPAWELSLVRHVRGHGIDKLARVGAWEQGATVLAPVRDGFVVAVGGRLLHGTAEPRSPLRDVTPSRLGVDLITGVVSEPRTGRLAVVVRHPGHVPGSLAVLGPEYEVLGHADVPEADGPTIKDIAFCGPERLITSHPDTRRLRSWRVEPSVAAEAATVFRDTIPLRLLPLPHAGLIMVETAEDRDDDHSLYGRYFREDLDARTLTPTSCSAALEWTLRADGRPNPFERLYLSPDGGCAALSRSPNTGEDSYANELEVRDLVREEIGELVRRSLARFRPADLAEVTDLAERAGDRPISASAALSLLRACLEYRFGADVAISDQPPALSADDVAL